MFSDDIFRVALSGSLVFLSACAVMNEKACLTADWNDLGFADGSAGYTMSRLSERIQACSKHGVTADRAQYLAGHRQGLKRYCTDAKGYAEGYHGNDYANVCTGQAEQQFLTAYRQGKRVYNQRKKISDLERKIERLQQKIDQARAEKNRQEAKLLTESTAEQRYVWLQKLNALNSEISDSRAEQHRLRDRRDDEQRRLTAMPENRY